MLQHTDSPTGTSGTAVPRQWGGPPIIDISEIQVISKIGSGCFGNVFRGVCRSVEVAVKVPTKQSFDPKQLAAFQHEVQIMSKIFHPNVSSAGEICVNTLKRDWKETHGIEHILLTIKCLLIVPNPKSALNEEAGRLLLEDYDGYFKKAKLWTSIYAPLDPAYQDLSQASDSSSSSSSSTSQPRQAKKVTSTAQKAKRNLKRL